MKASRKPPVVVVAPPADSVTTGEAAKAAGISRSMLVWLWNRGLAVPSVRNSRKGGSSSLWSPADVAAIALAVRARAELTGLACFERVPPTRLRQLAPNGGAIAVGLKGCSEVTPETTVAQLLHSLGGGPIAIVESAPRAPR